MKKFVASSRGLYVYSARILNKLMVILSQYMCCNSITSTPNLKPNPSLPADLILEILQWLPVLSLLRFKSVSKLWLSLISSQDFIKTHLSKSIEESQFTHRRLILSSLDPHFNVFSVNPGLIQPICEELEYPTKQLGTALRIVGSCNGLVCVAFEGLLFLWNPTTRKSRRVYNSDVNLPYRRHSEYVRGFGYDECNDDFKIVEIFCGFNYRGPFKTEVNLYSSRSDSWRRIEDFPVGVSLNYKPGKFANGALHWAVRPPNSEDSWIIVSLDMKSEDYKEVVQPYYGQGHYNLTLGTFGKYLSILSSSQKCRWDVWVMKEYGVTESWTKLVTISSMDDPRDYPYTPLYIVANGDILLYFGSRIQVYNSEDGRKDLAITGFNSCYQVNTYVESLVSPNL